MEEREGIKNESVVVQRVEAPNSYEFGKAGARFKLYFKTAEDLHAQIESLRALGYPVDAQ
jgi:hypothetical protein